MSERGLPWIHINRPTLATIHSVGKYIRRMDESHIYSNGGPLLKEFERRIGELLHLPSECVVACSSATLAIEGTVNGLGNAPLIIPDYTFAATGLATLNSTTQFQIVDIDFDTLTLNKFPLSSTGSNNSVPLFVAPFGTRIDIEVFGTSPRGIIDAAASLGQTIQNPVSIPEGWALIFSLHATKVLGAGEGGIAVFGDHRQAEEFRSFINFGYKDGKIGRTLGTNAKMSEVTAAYGLAALDEILNEEREWESSHSLARKHLQDLPVENFHSDLDVFQPYLIVRLSDKSEFDRVCECFERSRIQTRSWWADPLHKMPAFQKIIANSATQYPNADLASKTVLGLPMFRGLTEHQAVRISEALERAVR